VIDNALHYTFSEHYVNKPERVISDALDYICNKNWDLPVVDSIPLIACNALNISILIVCKHSGQHTLITPDRKPVAAEPPIAILRNKDHYDGLSPHMSGSTAQQIQVYNSFLKGTVVNPLHDLNCGAGLIRSSRLPTDLQTACEVSTGKFLGRRFSRRTQKPPERLIDKPISPPKKSYCRQSFTVIQHKTSISRELVPSSSHHDHRLNKSYKTDKNKDRADGNIVRRSGTECQGKVSSPVKLFCDANVKGPFVYQESFIDGTRLGRVSNKLVSDMNMPLQQQEFVALETDQQKPKFITMEQKPITQEEKKKTKVASRADTGDASSFVFLTTNPETDRQRLKPGFACPVPNCHEIIAPSMITTHLERHVQGIFAGAVPQTWLIQNRKFVCLCNRILSVSSENSHKSKCTANHATQSHLPLDSSNLKSEPTLVDLPTLEEIMSLNRPTLKHVPTKDRQVWGRVLQEAIHKATRSNLVEDYIYLAMLPKCVLPSAKRAGRSKSHNINISGLCEQWESGDRLLLWEKACQNARKVPKTSCRTNNEEDKKRTARLTQAAAVSFAEDGLYGKACRVLCSKGLAPNNQETHRLLTKKHPEQPPPIIPEMVVPAAQLPPSFDITEMLRSFPNGTACGPSGLRVEHLLEACQASLPVAVKTSIRHLINHLIAGRAPEAVAPYFAGAALTALMKSVCDAPLDIRPIAAGEVLRRLAGKCLCKLVAVKARELFEPHQFGVACPGGVEQVIHTMRKVLKEHWEDEDFVVMKIDMKNAFNSVSRQAILEECSQHLPEILPWVAWCYKSHPHLWHQLGNFSSAAGVQQGDPIGPLLFSLVINRLVKLLNKVDNLSHNLWFLDDGILCGTEKSMKECLANIKVSESWSGLELNIAKCELFSRGEMESLPPNMIRQHAPDMVVLGAPVGGDDFCSKFIVEKRQSAGELLNRISCLQDPQVSILLLRTCGGFCKLAHLARCCPPEQVAEPLGNFDEDVMKCLEEVAAIELTNRARTQAQLNLRSGGLGLRSLQKHAPAAYIASLTSSGNQVPLIALDLYNRQVDRGNALQQGNDILGQRNLSANIDQRTMEELLESSPSTSDRARLLAVSDSQSASWLTATPSPGLGCRLEANEVQILLKLRLGLSMEGANSSCPYCPEKMLDAAGHHALTCRCGPDIVHRHNKLRDCFNAACRSALLNPQLEQGSRQGSQTRPADIFIPVWTLGQPAAIDLTVVHPLNPEYISNGASTATEECLEAAEERKNAVNGQKCKELGWQCVPMAVTVYGVWGPEARITIKRVASRIAVREQRHCGEVLTAIYQQLGIVLARCTARAILARLAI
jgi:hypothetical protein